MREQRKNIGEKKRLLKEADITIKNNSSTIVMLYSRMNGGTFFELNPGDVEDIQFEDLQSIMKTQKKLFESFVVLVEDVYSPNSNDITVEDVEAVLGLSRVRKGLMETPDEYMFDDLLLDASFDEFKEEVSAMNKDVLMRMIERAVILYKDMRFSDSYKMTLMEKKLGFVNVFEDVDGSLKEIRSDIDSI